MGKADYYSEGDWNAVCFECGRKFKASEMRKHWQGYYTCQRCWKPRHPQDFVRAVPDEQAPPWTQPPPADEFTAVCDQEGISCWADLAVAECSLCEYEPPGLIADENLMLATEEGEVILNESNLGMYP